ncbi:MAG: NERD domain-containing protein, partial [Rhodoferax sp.]|nr:NERD domain-containing protein [Rhodoferax sp.]
MTPGERRLAERLESKLDDDYLLWYDVPVGPTNSHPDFVVIHPRRGLLILEVKDWKLSTIQSADKQTWTIIPDGTPKMVENPLEQARQYAHQVVDALKRDPQLTQTE